MAHRISTLPTAAEAIAAGITEHTEAEYIAQRYHARHVQAALHHHPGTEERRAIDDLVRIHEGKRSRARAARFALITAARYGQILTEDEIIAAWREGKHRAGVTHTP